MSEYQRRLFLAAENGLLGNTGGALHYTAIEHDDWCPCLKGNGECNCNPRITVTSWGPGKQPNNPPDDVFGINAAGERIPPPRQN